ncbi:SDR family NAD(P)-dependent oxidoreductase [Thalassomonas sp. RHCl1]|uniref:SDR family NAD(P)-dependent oxidoreductase n=1 Tax=Thalassomonas sp. RHCl1 TaxID=2995320 RepID=UPI00248B90F3|nr:SDR family NAD(P)-dependent oxidoreductase [Thalassomonas sp. RHCl1]
MKKSILITGATDGIGLATAKMLVLQGHQVLLHGRNPNKLEQVKKTLSEIAGNGRLESYLADLSLMSDVEALAKAVTEKHRKLDVLINNAGVYQAPAVITQDGLDIRFAVNTLAPYLLTKDLMPLLGKSARVINLSSAAQAPVNLEALAGTVKLSDAAAYAQSKLALTAWSRTMAISQQGQGPAIIAVNPGSMLGSKMVKQAFSVTGGDIQIGAKILALAAVDDQFSDAGGLYFDNDHGRFASPHPDVLDRQKSEAIVRAIDTLVADINRH